MMILCSKRLPSQPCQTRSPPKSWRTSMIHPRKGKTQISSNLQPGMGYYIVITSCTFQNDCVAHGYYKPVMMILLPATLGSRKHWSCYLEAFGGLDPGNVSRYLSRRMTHVLTPKRLTIGHVVFSTRTQFQVDHGPPYPWTL